MYANDARGRFPETFAHDFRIECARRAIAAYRRAGVLRRVAIGAVLALATMRAAYLYVAGAPDDSFLNSPPVWGVTLFVSFFTFTLEWSTYVQCKDALRLCGACWGRCDDARS
jgi:hypothetical protein